MAEEEPCSLASIARWHHLPEKEFEKQYKDHLSGFHQWDQKEHAEKYILFPGNIGPYLSLDEVDLSSGELYTVLTNKEYHGKKKTLVAMAKDTKSEDVALILAKIPQAERNKVKEVTVDLADSMERIVRLAFPNATIVNDRFHVQQLVSEAVQEVRIVFRKEAIREENEKIKQARENKERYHPFVYENGDTKKQLLARSRYLLFKPKSKWNDQQRKRSQILFKEFPQIKSVYELSMMFRGCYENSRTRQEAKNSFDKWYKKVSDKKIDSLTIAAESIRLHEETILNYFPDRSTNAAAESFNAKLKNFRTVVRGVVDKKFHLFRVAKLYA